ncbi:hypothetical protein T9A_00847 [Alcanivorax jadensis T9]|uniref:Helicase ATP-binding domain-containing protein n=1 Tax=Alcanivorax jadensis T9 TaxID=1177181 RepID=A0ABR4WG50_9GAMM|nr:type ISP restriction/modification enzyme [Alcanivorax jadensis]KGD62556.1 hypothetical protein T9A_00847 [Alcanivorax jadensis T9]
MSSPLYELLERYRTHAKTDREMGEYFELFVKAYFEHDDIQRQHYDQVWTYGDWAEEHGLSRKDTGIDLVARLRGAPETFCAIQCKFYNRDYKLHRKDLDGFFTASNRKSFTRRIIVDTTETELGTNVQALLDDAEQYVETYRISLRDLESSRIDWTLFSEKQEIAYQAKKQLRPHQEEALADVRAGLGKADRGKLIMACGTGKTFTSLKIAEDLAGPGKRVLFMVPSLALMSQTVTEWSNDATVPLRSFAVCSDAQVGKRKKGDDVADLQQHDLAFPATTDPAKLAAEAGQADPDAMTVVFSTYQSIQAISQAQQEHSLPEFDLVICDEAHRTTGVTLSGEDESNFVRIHDNGHVMAKKRLYMTATPRVFGDNAKGKADESGHELCSMDDKLKFGEVLFYRGFSWAVENDLLTDYKVIILAMDEGLVGRGVQRALSSGDNELQLDDASRIVGCYKALTKATLKDDIQYDAKPMRRALAFCRDIRSSKLIQSQFAEVVEEYVNYHSEEDGAPELQCSLEHVDGTFNAKTRNRLLDWLKAEPEPNECRILTNARCLSEGVDVPALDSIMFLHPRKSQIDVIQSVGRVMRKAGPSKRMGYVILPIGVPHGVTPEEALNDNERYRVVWQILNALRAHDESLDATINRASLGEDVSDKIQVVGINNEELSAVTAEVNNLPSRSSGNPDKASTGIGTQGEPENQPEDNGSPPTQLGIDFNAEISEAILAKLVKRCGTRDYWEDWATDIADIARKHITRIKATLEEGGKARTEFNAFLTELRDDLNDSIREDDAVEMLAQHIITRPVFETLFEGHQFTKENPVSKAIQRILDVLDEHRIDKESQSLEKFYESVKRRSQGIQTSHGKQRLVVELYDKFFRNAFPRLTQRLGIVYTPVEVVDFIIHSVNDILQSEFGQTLSSEGVHIIDPFTGTGTFITRLLQSGLIKPEEMTRKYQKEIHANEIVLLAYYIAAINIEAVYHDNTKAEYTPFEGICLTDTFQMYEKEDMVSSLLADNSERRKRQKELDLKVIIGNPPYSGQQSSENENNKNTSYPGLDARIRDTYAEASSSKLAKSNYDSYVRAIRWASDRIERKGVVAYVTNGSFIDSKNLDGLRKSLCKEFSKVLVFNLRGDAKKTGEDRRKEKGNIFGEGCRTPVAITILIKNSEMPNQGSLHYHAVGDYLTKEDKLRLIADHASISSVPWEEMTPNTEGDWINQRDPAFQRFLPLAERDSSNGTSVFTSNSYGVVTNRDPWVYNNSAAKLEKSVKNLIRAYNEECEKYRKASDGLGKGAKPSLEDVVSNDPKRISWTRALKNDAKRGKDIQFDPDNIVIGTHRPFVRQYMYFDRRLNEMVNLTKRMFPTKKHENIVISCTGVTDRKGFSCLVANQVPNMHLTDTGMCYPLYFYEDRDSAADLFDAAEDDPYIRRDGITDWSLSVFRHHYKDKSISKEDIFWYSYGVLHAPEYRNRFTADLQKVHPRIPLAPDFRAFSEAGRALGQLHLNFDSVEMHPVEIKISGGRSYEELTTQDFRVNNKWKFGGKAKDKDKSIVKYNSTITIAGVPVDAYDYVVNGKPALEWVMESQLVKTDTTSGIVNDANDYAIETMDYPAYPLELFRRVITVSLETMKIIRNLPELDI